MRKLRCLLFGLKRSLCLLLYNLHDCTFNLNDFADVIITMAPKSIVHTAVLQPVPEFEVNIVSFKDNVKSFTRVSDKIEMPRSK